MPFIKQPEKPKQYVFRLYKKHQQMLKRLAKETDASDAQVIREAIEEKHAFHFNR